MTELRIPVILGRGGDRFLLNLTVATPLWRRLGTPKAASGLGVRARLGPAVAMVVMATASTPLLLVPGRLLQGALGGIVEAAAAFAGSTGSDRIRGSALGSPSAPPHRGTRRPIADGLLVGSGGLSRLMLGIAEIAAALAIACAWGLRNPAHIRTTAERSTGAKQRERSSILRVPGADSREKPGFRVETSNGATDARLGG